MPLTRDFGKPDGRVGVLLQIDRVDRAAPASAARGEPVEARIELIGKINGKSPRRVFDKELVASDRKRLATTFASMPGAAAPTVSDLERFVEVDADDVKEAIDVAKECRAKLKDRLVTAVVVPNAEPAIGPPTFEPAPTDEAPNFGPEQRYLLPAPVGFGIAEAWRVPGGRGAQVNVVDLEGGWRLDHVELAPVRFSLAGGENSKHAGWLEHGTAVAGLLASSHDGKGVFGLCPDSRLHFMSIFDSKAAGQRIANQIVRSLELLSAGDVLLVELQRPGPSVDFTPNTDQKGYVPVSFWPDIRTAIQRVTQAGIVVVEVAGNGGVALDDKIYEGAFDQQENDSGGIFVGAGAPPFGDFGVPRSRLPFSNYGLRLDVQAWGQAVLTTGYGDLWGMQADETRYYTRSFMGTSSAGALIAGVAACVQGAHKARFGTPIHPFVLRQFLANVGWPQAGPTNERIGPQPDIPVLFAALGIV